jgi:hypothetical protein
MVVNSKKQILSCVPKDHKVTTHVNVFRQMAEELRGVGQPQTVDMIVSKIIQTLPPSYAVFETMWSGLPVADQTMAII